MGFGQRKKTGAAQHGEGSYKKIRCGYFLPSVILFLSGFMGPLESQAQNEALYRELETRQVAPTPTPTPSPTARPTPTAAPSATPTAPKTLGPQQRQFEVPRNVKTPPAQVRTDKPKVDSKKVKSLFDKAKVHSKSEEFVGVNTADGMEANPEIKKTPSKRNRIPEGETLPPAREKKGSVGPATVAIGDQVLVPEAKFKQVKPEVYLIVPQREGVELPKGGADLPGTGLPGESGVGGVKGGFQGGLERPDINFDTGEEAYMDGMPGGYDPAIDPSGSMGEVGGWMGTAGQAYGGKGGKTMEQVGGLMQSQSAGQALGTGANILLPGSGGFVEAAAHGDTGGMVNAGATAAGSLASDLVIGLIVGLAGGGLLGLAVGYALSATGASKAIADGVRDGLKWVAEKVGLGGGKAPDPAPAPEPSPDPNIYDERNSNTGGKKGPSVINENQILPLQENMKKDPLGKNRDKEVLVDTSDTPAPGRVVFGPGCDPEELGAASGGSFDPSKPLTVKDMEKPGYDKASK